MKPKIALVARTLLAGALLAAALASVSCAHQRFIGPEQNALADTFRWYASPDPNGSSSVSFILGGKLVFIDPVINPELYPLLPEADLILITHTHRDHYSPESIAALSGPDTIVAGINRLRSDVPRYTPLLPGNEVSLAGLTVTAVHAWNAYHDPAGNDLGFTVSDGRSTVFVSGDTDWHDEYRTIKNIDVALFFMFPPMTLSLADAVKMGRMMKPAVIIPVHWNPGQERDMAALEKALASVSQVRILAKTDK